jgi:hypothetical protein
MRLTLVHLAPISSLAARTNGRAALQYSRVFERVMGSPSSGNAAPIDLTGPALPQHCENVRDGASRVSMAVSAS